MTQHFAFLGTAGLKATFTPRPDGGPSLAVFGSPAKVMREEKKQCIQPLNTDQFGSNCARKSVDLPGP